MDPSPGRLLTLLPVTTLTSEERVLRASGSTSHGVQSTKETKLMQDLKRQDSESPPGPGVSRGPCSALQCLCFHRQDPASRHLSEVCSRFCAILPEDIALHRFPGEPLALGGLRRSGLKAIISFASLTTGLVRKPWEEGPGTTSDTRPVWNALVTEGICFPSSQIGASEDTS